MGMFTELNVAFELKPVMDVVAIIDRMCRSSYRHFDCKGFDHSFFKTEKWREMLLSGSLYFPGQPDSNVFVRQLPGDEPRYYVNIRCNLKNYDKEIELFLDWVAPYILTEGFIGYVRYETEPLPTLVCVEGGRVSYSGCAVSA